MSTVIGYGNLADSGAISASTQNSLFPATNAQNQHVSKQWNSTVVGPTTSHIDVDLGAAQTIQAIGAINTNATSVAITAGATQGAATYAPAALVPVKSQAILYVSPSQSHRWWRFTFTPPSGQVAKCGRIFLGPSFVPTYGISFDWQVVENDLSLRAEVRSGETWIRTLPKVRAVEFEMAALTESEAWGIAASLDAVLATGADVLFIPEHSSAYYQQQSVFGLLAQQVPRKNIIQNTWSVACRVEERK
jgi:hypothetical protein